MLRAQSLVPPLLHSLVVREFFDVIGDASFIHNPCRQLRRFSPSTTTATPAVALYTRVRARAEDVVVAVIFSRFVCCAGVCARDAKVRTFFAKFTVGGGRGLLSGGEKLERSRAKEMENDGARGRDGGAKIDRKMRDRWRRLRGDSIWSLVRDANGGGAKIFPKGARVEHVIRAAGGERSGAQCCRIFLNLENGNSKISCNLILQREKYPFF